MIIILGQLSGALGLFFMGVKLLTDQLKALTNRRLRLSVARWTNGRWMGFLWGMVAGSVMQSMTVLTLIILSTLRSDLVSPKRAFPILLGGNVAAALLVLVVTLDVKLIALYVLGIAQLLSLLLAKDQGSHYRAMAVACFGMGMIVLGSIMLKESVAPLATYPWFQQALEWMGGSLVLPLLTGAVLTLVVQSSIPVVVSGIGMAAAGLLSVEQVLMSNCGACLGSSLILYLLTLTVKGRARQVAMYQVLYNIVLNAIFVPLICVEAYFDVPLAVAAVHASGLSLTQSLAAFVIFCEVFTSLFQLATLDVAARLVGRWWPPTEVEALAKTQFIHDRALNNARDALHLVDLEQRRLLDILSRYLDTVRRGVEVGELRESARELLNRIAEFLDDLAARCPDHEVDAHNSMMTRQELFNWLEEHVFELCRSLHGLPAKSPLGTWSTALVEGLDAVLLVLTDALESDDPSVWPSTTQLMGDRTESLRRLRDRSLKGEAGMGPSERRKLLKFASTSERIFLLMSRLAHQYRQASGVDAAFLYDAVQEDPAGMPSARTDVRLAAGSPVAVPL